MDVGSIAPRKHQALSDRYATRESQLRVNFPCRAPHFPIVDQAKPARSLRLQPRPDFASYFGVSPKARQSRCPSHTEADSARCSSYGRAEPGRDEAVSPLWLVAQGGGTYRPPTCVATIDPGQTRVKPSSRFERAFENRA